MVSDPAATTVAAAAQIVRSLAAGSMPIVRSFFDEPTNTASHVVHDPATRQTAIIDSVLGFDAAAGRIDTRSADAIVSYVRDQRLTNQWLLETHAHADHLSAAPYLRAVLGGTVGIGRGILRVQAAFGAIFNTQVGPADGGSDFDRLFDDGERLTLGAIDAMALHVPGHTPADVIYVIGDAVFTGDTLFMPDAGTARADFPGGDAATLYRSIRRILSLPKDTRLFLCHDYAAAGRHEFAWETTVGAQRAGNVHVHDGIDEAAFVAMRTRRDATLPMPKLLLPAIQVNIRAGRLPAAEANGIRYLKLPIDAL